MAIQGLPSAQHPVTTDTRGWQVLKRPGSGLFIASPSGTLLFRIDLAAGVIYPWDRKVGHEIAVPLEALRGLSIAAT